MLFYLTTLNLAKFLREDAPICSENEADRQVVAMDAWKHSDFLCKNYILNGLVIGRFVLCVKCVRLCAQVHASYQVI